MGAFGGSIDKLKIGCECYSRRLGTGDQKCDDGYKLRVG